MDHHGAAVTRLRRPRAARGSHPVTPASPQQPAAACVDAPRLASHHCTSPLTPALAAGSTAGRLAGADLCAGPGAPPCHPVAPYSRPSVAASNHMMVHLSQMWRSTWFCGQLCDVTHAFMMAQLQSAHTGYVARGSAEQETHPHAGNRSGSDRQHPDQVHVQTEDPHTCKHANTMQWGRFDSTFTCRNMAGGP